MKIQQGFVYARFALLIGIIVGAVMGGGVQAFASSTSSSSGLPLPRFVSVRSDEANVRSGPGARYPVQWVLLRRNMPVEVIGEYENWRKIRDWQGTEGWINQALLSGRRFVVIYPTDTVLRMSPDTIASPVARLGSGVIARVSSCRASWCEVQVNEIEGWVNKESIWGAYPDEVLER